MNQLLASLTLKQRLTILAVAAAVIGGIYGVVSWNRERDFKPLFTGLSQEDAAAIVQKLKENGADYRLPDSGGAVLVASARLAELRLTMAAAGIPHSGRIGFELFDKTNFGATEFAEQVNYRRAVEGELERSVMSLAEVEQARVHITFPKNSVFVEAQQPAKASVMVKLRPGVRLAAQNVQAINHLVASAVEGLLPDAVSVLDMNGNLLGRARTAAPLDGSAPSEAVLDFRHKVEADLLTKVNATLEPLLGADKFRAGVSVECDFSGGDQSEEILDPARSVMLSSQRTEDTTGTGIASGVPGTASTLPRPTSRPAAGSGRTTRVTENIAYQSSRTVKRTRQPAGTVKRISLAVLVDQAVNWEKDKTGPKKVLVPPAPEKLKTIRDLVAGVTGLNTERGDQLTVETLPFESTLNLEPPPPPGAAPSTPPANGLPPWAANLTRTQLLIGGGAAAGVVLLVVVGLVFMLRKKKKPSVTVRAALPPGPATGQAPGTAAGAVSAPANAAVTVAPGAGQAAIDQKLEATLAERDAMQHQAEERALNALMLQPVITKTAEVLAKHLRENIKKEPEVPAQILRSWIREGESGG